MLTSHRRALLAERLATHGKIVATEAAADLAVSEDTIRRDLREMAADGRLLRVHGGALPLSPTHKPFATRSTMATDEKHRLATAAHRLIQPGMVVFVDGGTTHQALARCLPADLACTIVTHSPAFAAALEGHQSIDIILIRGRIFRHSMVAAGPIAEQAISRIHADLCLVGVTGLHPETGLTTGDPEEAALKRTIIDSAAEVAVLATTDKLAATSPWGIAPLDVLGTLVTCTSRPDWLPPETAHIKA